MKKHLIISIISLALGLSACSQDGGGKPDATKTVTINGHAPIHYYGQFIYKMSGSCANEDLYYNYLKSDPVDLRKSENGLDVIGVIHLYLIDRENYFAVYREIELEVRNSYGYRGQIISEKKLSGKYSYEDGPITVGNIGKGEGLKSNGRDGILFTFGNEIPAAQGKVTALNYEISASSDVAGDEQVYQICKNGTHR